jgi:hypothetical protein
LIEVAAKLLTQNLGAVFEYGKTAKPFGANVMVAFAEYDAVAVVAVVHGGEMKKQADVNCLPDRAELLHQDVIEAGEVLVVEGLDDWIGEHDGAGNDGVGRR